MRVLLQQGVEYTIYLLKDSVPVLVDGSGVAWKGELESTTQTVFINEKNTTEHTQTFTFEVSCFKRRELTSYQVTNEIFVDVPPGHMAHFEMAYDTGFKVTVSRGTI